jgi:hypothetical protein
MGFSNENDSSDDRRKEKPMRKGLKHALLALGAALIVGGAASKAAAQPANCGDVNNDGQINSVDLSALQAGTINPACTATNCADVNAVGGVELGDQIVLSRFLIGGGTIGEPGRSAGEQNLLFKLCTTAPAAVACNTSGTALTGRITTNQTWPGPAEGCNEFFIRGRVTFANNSTLTIRPGAVIRAVVNPADPALILITRGSKINANGAINPIILTSAAAPGARNQGDWGGVVINGFAPENFVGEGSSEGLPPGPDAVYGGNNPNALSAVLRFVRIEFSGVVIGEANELNVLTMNSIGRLSTIDHVQVNQGQDDGFEWFGGNVRQQFLVATGVGDDGFDWQIGYQGQPDPATTPLPAVQFGLVAHDAESVGTDPDAHGMEGDNSEFGFGLQPRSAPYFCNITAVGPRDTGVTTGITSDGARLRRGTAGRIENSIFEKWLSNGIDIRDGSPIDIAPTVSIFDSGGTPCIDNGTGQCADATVAGASLLQGPLTYPGDVGGYCNAAGVLIDNRYNLAAATAAPDDCAAADPFFDPAPYPGAFNAGGAASNWLTTDKPCCPSGDPFAVIGGQRCWISFDIH